MKRLFYILVFIPFLTTAQIESDTFNIVFYHTFESNSLGYYDDDTIDKDWDVQHSYEYIINDSVKIVDDPTFGHCMRVLYQEGQYGLHEGTDASGASWTGGLPSAPHDELYMSFAFMVNDTFDPVLSGKINALYGYPQVDPCVYNEDGFGVILTWDNIDQEDYQWMCLIYHLDQGAACGDIINFSPVASIDSGAWHNIAIRVSMNDPGYANGVLEIFYDSAQVYTGASYEFRNSSGRGIDWIQVTSFFGGGEGSEATQDEYAWFDDFYVWYYKPGLDTIKYGLDQGVAGRHIPIPPPRAYSESGGGESQVYERYIDTPNDNSPIFGVNYQLQGYTIGTNGFNIAHYLDTFKIKTYKIGTVGTLTVDVYDSDTIDLLSTGTIDANTFTIDTDGDWYGVPMSSYYAEPSTTYIAIAHLVGGDAENYVNWKQNTAGTYSGGNNCYSDDSGVSWECYAGVDVLFQEIGHEETGKTVTYHGISLKDAQHKGISPSRTIKYRNITYE